MHSVYKDNAFWLNYKLGILVNYIKYFGESRHTWNNSQKKRW